MYSCLSMIFLQIIRHTLQPGAPCLRDRFLRVTLVPCEVFVPLTGSFGGWFGFSPFNGLFSSLSVIFVNYRHTLKPGVPRLRGQFLRVTLVPCEVFVPPTGSFGGWFGFSPFNGMFLCFSNLRRLSVIFGPVRNYGTIILWHVFNRFFRDPIGTTPSVPTSHIGPVRGVRASYGVVWGLVYGFHPLTACFQV